SARSRRTKPGSRSCASRMLRCRRPRAVQWLCSSAGSAPRNVTLWTDSRSCMDISIAFFDGDSEPLAVGREFGVQVFEALTDVGQQAGGVTELPVAVAEV